MWIVGPAESAQLVVLVAGAAVRPVVLADPALPLLLVLSVRAAGLAAVSDFSAGPLSDADPVLGALDLLWPLAEALLLVSRLVSRLSVR